MVCWPLIERELRVALRKQQPVRARLNVALLTAVGSLLILLLSDLTGSGPLLAKLLCLAGLYSIVRVPMLTAGTVAEERRNQTLGLLFLSGLGSWEVFASKVLSSALIACSNLLAIFPMLALPFLIGGVSFDLFLAATCAMPTLMFFALAVSLLASVLARDEGGAVVLAFALATVFCLASPAIYAAQSYFSPGTKPSLWLWRLSPAYGPRLVWSGFSAGFSVGEQAEFWRNLVFTLSWSWMALAAAGLGLKRLWRDREEEAAFEGWSERWRRFVHGSPERRKCLGQLWLRINPFVWLATRDRQPAVLGWIVLTGIVLSWLVCWAAWPTQWPSVQNFFITATLLNLALDWITRHTAARVLGEARRDGTYELLLTTSLNPNEIVSGTLEGLRQQFRPLTTLGLWLNVVMMLGGLLTHRWSAGALVVYFSIWLLLLTGAWNLASQWSRLLLVMWASLNCARPAHAVWRASGFRPWSSLWILFNLQTLGRGFSRFPSGSLGEVIFALVVVVIWLWRSVERASRRAARFREFRWDPQAKAWIDGSIGILETRLIREFREIVREPLPDPTDPRFKRWSVYERFPWGWAMVQQQLHERLARK